MELYKVLVGFVGLSLDFSGGSVKLWILDIAWIQFHRPVFFHRVVMASSVSWYQRKCGVLEAI